MIIMQLYDSHCHLEALATDMEIKPVAVPAVMPSDAIKLYDYRQRNSLAKIGSGLHPWYVKEYVDLPELEALLRNQIETLQPDFIGECGLDKLKPDFSYQQEVFNLHLQLANEYHKPIVIHCVRAYNETLELLTIYPQVRGVVHGFNGNSEIARQLIQKNMFLGIGSIICNQNSQLVKSIAKIALERLLIESDAPYMPPSGKGFSSTSDCWLYAHQLATLKKQDLDNVVSVLNTNWHAVFG